MLTPAMQQYIEIKSQYQDCIILFRMGDFYESFYDDAKELADILGITLTARDKERKIPMAGIPFHALDSYLEKLIQANKKVVLVEQLENPQPGKIVKRGIVKIFTPSTTFFDSEISKESNYLFSVIKIDKTFDCSFCDIKEGKIYHVIFDNKFDFINNLQLINPRELLLSSSHFSNKEIIELQNLLPNTLINTTDSLLFDSDKFLNFINQNLKTLIGDKKTSSIIAILNYFVHTQLTKVEHITEIVEFKFNDFMKLSIDVLRGLEIFEGQRVDSIPLIKVIDNTLTAGGARLLRDWLKKPILNKDLILSRQEKIKILFESGVNYLETLRNILIGISDMHKISTKISLKTANPRDLRYLLESYQKILIFFDTLVSNSVIASVFKENFNQLNTLINSVNNIMNKIDAYIIELPPVSIRDGGFIKRGISKELDALYEIKQNSKDWIKSFEANEIKRTGINSLKVRFNKVFGFYIEISKNNINKVPHDYIRKQTLVNAERFITPELKEYEAKALNAEEQIKNLEYEIFINLLDELNLHVIDLQKIAFLISEFDVFISFAYIALNYNWVCPQITEDFAINIENGFHPVVEYTLKKMGKLFVKNSYIVDKKSSLQIITGPNMGGKSTFLRQVALIIYLAQIGSFVPAEKASIGIVDNIFTRIGASDNLAKGESTFMVEMQEMAYILNNCTNKSLILLDEVGRGTSTFDGMSLAWAICEYLADKGIKTLFATHYHELTELGEHYDNVKNLCIKVSEFNGEIVFLHQIINGKSDKSYGIHVAKLAGIPSVIITRAKKILIALEKLNGKINTQQISLFDVNLQEDFNPQNNYLEIIEILNSIDLNSLSPIDAFNIVLKLKNLLNNKSNNIK